MGAYKYISKTFQEEYKSRSQIYRTRISGWRKSGAVVRVEKPTNISRARSLGYKSKTGIFVVRVKVSKGLRKRRDPKAGRKAKHNYRYTQTSHNYKSIAEQKAARKHRNSEVINGYFIGEDGQYKFFEVILADTVSNSLDEHTKKTISNKGRVFRGITSSFKKSRGYRVKGRRKLRRRSYKKEQKIKNKRK